MIKEFTFSFNELNVTSSEIQELLGIEGEAPEPFPELIEKGLKEAPEYCDIRGGIKTFDTIITDSNTTTIKVEDQVFRTARVVAIQLKEASGAALFICTAGKGITDYSKKIAAEGDLMYSYVIDTIGSATVDKAMDQIQEELRIMMEKKELGVSDRFSPGYCEWNVSDQQKLFKLFPPGFCGITLTESSLMEPIKSVSGIIGTGPGLKQKGYQCHWCSDPNCIYGKTKRKKRSKKND